MVQAEPAIPMVDPTEANSLYFLFNNYKLGLNCSDYDFYPFCVLVPYGVGTGTGAGTLPGGKPLKPPGTECVCIACILNKPLHPRFMQRVISYCMFMFLPFCI